MPSNSYDLVVLGEDLAALVCATLCARPETAVKSHDVGMGSAPAARMGCIGREAGRP